MLEPNLKTRTRQVSAPSHYSVIILVKLVIECTIAINTTISSVLLLDVKKTEILSLISCPCIYFSVNFAAGDTFGIVILAYSKIRSILLDS